MTHTGQKLTFRLAGLFRHLARSAQFRRPQVFLLGQARQLTQIDRKRERQFGSAWGPIAMTTSVIPFAAIARGRTQMDWAGIGWWRPALAIALFVVLQYAHAWIFGVSALPVL